jgi:hypothetical protein
VMQLRGNMTAAEAIAYVRANRAASMVRPYERPKPDLSAPWYRLTHEERLHVIRTRRHSYSITAIPYGVSKNVLIGYANRYKLAIYN